jgi:hypothetical protein
MSRSVADAFRAAADRHRKAMESRATVPPHDNFFEAARGLLATDPELPRIIRTSRARAKLIKGTVNKPGEKEDVLAAIFLAIDRARNGDVADALAKSADRPNNTRANRTANRAAVLGALRAFLAAKGLLSPNSDPGALKKAQAFLIKSQWDVNRLQRQVHGAKRYE